MKKKDEAWAIFWCTLLHPILFGEIEPNEVRRFLGKLSKEERLFPNGVRRMPSLSTLRRKLDIYQEQGFDALARKPRDDRGTTRAHRPDVIERAIELKRDQPKRSHRTINKFLETEFKQRIPPSTLYRHLKNAGATQIKIGVDDKKVRRRFSRDHTHDLWVGDFEQGPYVVHQGQVVSSHLSAFIDCHSRFLIEGRYYFRENLDILIDSLLRAWACHGASSQLYVDNAKIYHSRGLKTACYRLTIELLHRPPKDPPAGGLIERFFETTQSNFEAEVRAGEILTIEQLNKAFSAWLEMSYHQEIHSEIHESPKQRYEAGLRVLRTVDIEKARQSFFQRETRRVDPDFSDVRLANRLYRVDKRFRGDKVEVHYDPFSDQEGVLIYSLEGVYLGKGSLHHREKGGDPSPPSTPKKAKHSYLDLLISQHENELKKSTRGIDYRCALKEGSWPFPSFAKSFAQLLGRKGDLSSFTTLELETLRNTFNRCSGLDEILLIEAFENAPEKTLPYVVYELQETVSSKKNPKES